MPAPLDPNDVPIASVVRAFRAELLERLRLQPTAARVQRWDLDSVTCVAILDVLTGAMRRRAEAEWGFDFDPSDSRWVGRKQRQ